MIRVLVSSVVERRFEPWSVQTKHYRIVKRVGLESGLH